ncbi:MAG: response regulator [Deltaproteobacteria bacterium]|nr:response regulator [Deltaproteobacteria bacterium]
MTDKKILVVDDDEAIRRLEEKILSSQGYQVRTARDGNEALQALKEGTFHLILLDVMMPGLNGFEVGQAVKGDPATAEIPIVFVTAKGDTEAQREGYRSGGMLYLTKPFTSTKLLSVVKTVVGVE